MATVWMVGLYVGLAALIAFMYRCYTYHPARSLPSGEQLQRLTEPVRASASEQERLQPEAPDRSASATQLADGNAAGQLAIPEGYQRTHAWLMLLAFPVFLVLLLGVPVLLGAVAFVLSRARHPPALLLFDESYLMAGGVGIWLGIFSFPLVMDRLTRLILGARRHQEYNQYHMNQWGRDLRPFFAWFFLIVTTMLTGLLILGMDCYTRFEEERIVVNSFWGFGEVSYPYGRVRGIVYVSHTRNVFGTQLPRDAPVMTLVFDDGRQWTPEFGKGETEPMGGRIAELVASKTGLPILQARFAEDVVRP
jgi:hypothetical protein